jgi:hypothetical protein
MRGIANFLTIKNICLMQNEAAGYQYCEQINHSGEVLFVVFSNPFFSFNLDPFDIRTNFGNILSKMFCNGSRAQSVRQRRDNG